MLDPPNLSRSPVHKFSVSRPFPENMSRGELVTIKIVFKMADEEKSTYPIFVVDAFTDKPFGGNPAAVCLVGAKVS